MSLELNWALSFLGVIVAGFVLVYGFLYLRTFLAYRRLGKRIRNLPVIPSSNPHWQEKVIQAAFRGREEASYNDSMPTKEGKN